MLIESYLRQDGDKIIIVNEYDDSEIFIQEISREIVDYFPNEALYKIKKLKEDVDKIKDNS